MSTGNEKKRARDLQAITGMPYQAAHRAVVSGTEYEASLRSGYGLSDFVTPREIRVWLQVNAGVLRCAEGGHRMWTDELGQCLGCGVPMAVDLDDEGQEFLHLISEEEFLERCVAVEMYYNWAPPMSMLDGMTQAEYFHRYWRRTWVEDESPAPAAGLGNPWAVEADQVLPDGLSSTHIDLLQVVGELEEPSHHPGTKVVGQRLLELWQSRKVPYVWLPSTPWHGTDPYADELRTAGLLHVGVGMARLHRPGEPAHEVEQYWLGLTDAGREVLAASGS